MIAQFLRQCPRPQVTPAMSRLVQSMRNVVRSMAFRLLCAKKCCAATPLPAHITPAVIQKNKAIPFTIDSPFQYDCHYNTVPFPNAPLSVQQKTRAAETFPRFIFLTLYFFSSGSPNCSWIVLMKARSVTSQSSTCCFMYGTAARPLSVML